MLDLNISVLFIFLLLWILYFLSNRFFFRPVGQIIRQRESKIAQDKQTLQKILAEISERTESVERKIQAAQKESLKIKETLIQQGEEIRRRLVEEARSRSTELFTQKMAQMQTDLERTEKELDKEISIFSQKIKEAFLS